MKDFSSLIEKVEEVGNECYWSGGANNDQIMLLESLLELKLPNTFKKFLEEYGGGGVIDDEILGIEENNALLKTGGTMYGATIYARQEYNLPNKLAVILFRDEDICWCLYTGNFDEAGECPVVNYNLFSQKAENQLSQNFEVFLKEYLELWGEE